MHRKDFIKTASLISAGIFSSEIFSQNFYPEDQNLQIIKPQRLKEGDKVGLISPGGFINANQLKESIENISKLGFEVIPAKNILKKNGYLAGSDLERAGQVNSMFEDKNIKGIFCTRGGFGCSRILPYLNFDLIKENPKPLIGYSDITILSNVIFQKTGLVGFHGPVGISTFNDFSVYYFKEVLMNANSNLELISEPENLEDQNQIPVTIRGGIAKGKLTGGNLSVITSLTGTEYDLNFNGKIIFLEEVTEEPYRLDRMLTQLIQAKKFENAVGIALGNFYKCEPKEPENSFSLLEILYDKLYDLKIPVVYGLSFGHIKNKFTLPVGISAELNADEQKMKILESAVN